MEATPGGLGMLKLRLMGSPQEINAAISELRTLPKLRILKVSSPSPNRKDPGVRVYVDVEVVKDELG